VISYICGGNLVVLLSVVIALAIENRALGAIFRSLLNETASKSVIYLPLVRRFGRIRHLWFPDHFEHIFMTDFFISAAHAADAGSGSPFPGMDIFIIVAFALVFYFIVWRPQSKRAKEHKELVTSLNKGDEVVTNGGMLGKITKVDDHYIVIEIAEKVEIKVQKGAISSALPKGTIKGI
jgi:preprotein translocase subunit YajC